MGRTRLQTRADADTVEQVEQYCDEKDISESEATRRLIRKGLRTEGLRGEAVSSEADVPDDATSKYAMHTVGLAYMVAGALGSSLGVVISGVL